MIHTTNAGLRAPSLAPEVDSCMSVLRQRDQKFQPQPEGSSQIRTLVIHEFMQSLVGKGKGYKFAVPCSCIRYLFRYRAGNSFSVHGLVTL